MMRKVLYINLSRANFNSLMGCHFARGGYS